MTTFAEELDDYLRVNRIGAEDYPVWVAFHLWAVFCWMAGWAGGGDR